LDDGVLAVTAHQKAGRYRRLKQKVRGSEEEVSGPQPLPVGGGRGGGGLPRSEDRPSLRWETAAGLKTWAFSPSWIGRRGGDAIWCASSLRCAIDLWQGKENGLEVREKRGGGGGVKTIAGRPGGVGRWAAWL